MFKAFLKFFHDDGFAATGVFTLLPPFARKVVVRLATAGAASNDSPDWTACWPNSAALYANPYTGVCKAVLLVDVVRIDLRVRCLVVSHGLVVVVRRELGLWGIQESTNNTYLSLHKKCPFP